MQSSSSENPFGTFESPPPPSTAQATLGMETSSNHSSGMTANISGGGGASSSRAMSFTVDDEEDDYDGDDSRRHQRQCNSGSGSGSGTPQRGGGGGGTGGSAGHSGAASYDDTSELFQMAMHAKAPDLRQYQKQQQQQSTPASGSSTLARPIYLVPGGHGGGGDGDGSNASATPPPRSPTTSAVAAASDSSVVVGEFDDVDGMDNNSHLQHHQQVGGDKSSKKSYKSGFDPSAFAESNIRLDRPHDVALEYNRKMLYRHSLLLSIVALPLLYLTPVVGLMFVPSAALVAYWASQKERFQHGGDVHACVNRDCSIVVGIVFVTIALSLEVWNVGDLLVGDSSCTGCSSSKSQSSSSSSSGKNVAITSAPPSPSSTTKNPLRLSEIGVGHNGALSFPPSQQQRHLQLTPSPSTHYYTHKHEAIAHSPGLRKAEIIAGLLAIVPAVGTLRYLFRIRNLVLTPSGVGTVERGVSEDNIGADVV